MLKVILKILSYKKDEIFILKDTANLSTGGTAEDVTDIVHPSNVSMAERISKIIDLDICGIDIMTTDISQTLIGNRRSSVGSECRSRI